MFDAKNYWENRPVPNARDDMRIIEKNDIRNFLQSAGTILDFGCGDGRTISLYPKDVPIVGVDFVDTYKKKIKKKAKEEGVNLNHIIHDIEEKPLPFDDNEFTHGLCIKVLLHVEEPKKIIEELLRVCNNVLFTTTLFDDRDDEDISPHCFHHNYRDLFYQYELKKFKLYSGDQLHIII